MRTPLINAALQTSLTTDRLGKYLAASNNDLHQALKLYEDNAKLSEAFYTPLQSLEVCLRNSLHFHMTAAYGANWFKDSGAPLQNESVSMIDSALYELRNEPQPLRPGSVVAELKFAFWVGLLGPAYDDNLWRKNLYKAFLARGGKKRSAVHSRFNALRRFRNRIAHHEPILWRATTPVDTNAEIVEAIGWMCRHTSSWAANLSRVEAVATGIAAADAAN